MTQLSARKRNIILVERDLGDVEIITEMLTNAEKTTPRISIAASLQEALLTLGEMVFDIAIIDISIPEDNELQLLSELGQKYSHLPCVLLSGFSDREMVLQNVPLASRNFLYKHRLTPSVLAEAIKQVIHHQDLLNNLEKSRQGLVASELRFRTMIEKNADVIVILNRAGEIKYINPVGEEIFGQDGAGLDEHVSSFPVISGQNKEFVFQSENQKLTWEVRVVITDWQGETAFLATLRNVTERKQAEKALRKTMLNLQRSNEDLETFAYVTSHDLQEPLRTVTSFLGLLKRRYQEGLDDKANHYIIRSIAATKRMQAMILSLLEYSRLSTQSQPFAMNDLGDLLDQALDNLSGAIADSGAKVTRDPLPEVWCEANQIIRLLQNLIGNAIKFCKDRSPEIHIGVEKEDLIYHIKVKDNGIGIEPEYLERIFIIFQRLNNQNYPGTGIGLAMCKKIVESHGGRIWVESAPDQGSTFNFTLSGKAKGVKQ